VSRDGDAIIVRIPVRFHRRNGRQMVLTRGGDNGHDNPERETNGSLVSAMAKLIGGRNNSSRANMRASRTWRRRPVSIAPMSVVFLRLTSHAPEIVERILNGDEPVGISLRGLKKALPVWWARYLRSMEISKIVAS
jgi:hypothetical protein